MTHRGFLPWLAMLLLDVTLAVRERRRRVEHARRVEQRGELWPNDTARRGQW